MFGGLIPKPPRPARGAEETEDQCSARVVREEMRAARSAYQCPAHGPDSVCMECMECFPLDLLGFVRSSAAAGRMPVRRCRRCKRMRTMGEWNLQDGHHCKDCLPRGSLSDVAREWNFGRV
jgi:hypothetical protein